MISRPSLFESPEAEQAFMRAVYQQPVLQLRTEKIILKKSSAVDMKILAIAGLVISKKLTETARGSTSLETQPMQQSYLIMPPSVLGAHSADVLLRQLALRRNYNSSHQLLHLVRPTSDPTEAETAIARLVKNDPTDFEGVTIGGKAAIEKALNFLTATHEAQSENPAATLKASRLAAVTSRVARTALDGIYP